MSFAYPNLVHVAFCCSKEKCRWKRAGPNEMSKWKRFFAYFWTEKSLGFCGGNSQHQGDEYVKYLKANDTTGVQDRHWETVQWCKISNHYSSPNDWSFLVLLNTKNAGSESVISDGVESKNQEYLAKAAHKLDLVAVDLIVICSNTAHICYSHLRKRFPERPILHIVDCVAKAPCLQC